MHLERDILKGKFGKDKELIKEAHEEIEENKHQKGAIERKTKETVCPHCGKKI